MNPTWSRRSFLNRTSLAAAALAAGNAVLLAGEAIGETGIFNVQKFGATGDGETKDTAAVQRAIDAAGTQGGRVYFPPGRFLCGTLRLRSQVTIQLDNGATLVAARDRADFDPYEKLKYNSFADLETTDFNFALIRGRDVEHITILGPGRIDMAGRGRGGPKAIALKLCRHIQIRDLTIENSPNYNISLLGCDFVDIFGVTIRNGYCDGIDPDCCRHVRIANCFVESWDDAIVPKASPALGYLRPTEHLAVTNCVLTTGCSALKLGTESSGGFKDILFSNCSVYSDTKLWPGHRAGSGISLITVDGGALERIAISNITMRDVRAPIFVRLANRGRAQAKPVPDHLSDISISDIVATDAMLPSSVTGVPGFPVKGVTLRNIRVTARGGGKAAWATRAVPEQQSEYPDAGRLGDLPAYGLYCRHVDGLVLDGINLGFDEPEHRPALVLDDVSNVDMRMVLAKAPEPGQPVAHFHNTRDGFVQGCRALKGTSIWAAVSGEQTVRLRTAGNDLAEAEKPFEIGSEVPSGAVSF